MKCGLEATVIGYRNQHDIDVKFSNGIIAKHKTYPNFKRGAIGCPGLDTGFAKARAKHLNEEGITSDGLKMWIIEYRSQKDIDVELENGYILQHKNYNDFKTSVLGNPDRCIRKHVGEVSKNSNGMNMRITRYGSQSDIDIEFEDGQVVKNAKYSAFKRGDLQHPTINSKIFKNEKKMVGVRKRMNNQIEAEISEYRKAADITVRFIDGYETDTRVSDFNRGLVNHPILKKGGMCEYLNFFVDKSVKRGNHTYLFCTCKKCGNQECLTVEEAVEHRCV